MNQEREDEEVGVGWGRLKHNRTILLKEGRKNEKNSHPLPSSSYNTRFSRSGKLLKQRLKTLGGSSPDCGVPSYKGQEITRFRAMLLRVMGGG